MKEGGTMTQGTGEKAKTVMPRPSAVGGGVRALFVRAVEAWVERPIARRAFVLRLGGRVAVAGLGLLGGMLVWGRRPDRAGGDEDKIDGYRGYVVHKGMKVVALTREEIYRDHDLAG